MSAGGALKFEPLGTSHAHVGTDIFNHFHSGPATCEERNDFVQLGCMNFFSVPIVKFMSRFLRGSTTVS